MGMGLDMTEGRIHLVICGSDGRLGFERLAQICTQFLGIDIYGGQDWVVFVNRRRKVAKIIHCDERGAVMVVRYLSTGRYQKLMAAAESGPALRTIDRGELMRYLDGEKLDIYRRNYLKY